MFCCCECGDTAAAFIEKRHPDHQIIIRKYLCGKCLTKLGDNIRKIAYFVRIVSK